MTTLRDGVLKALVAIGRPNRGQGYTEYVILVGLIAIVAYAAVQLLGTNLSSLFNTTAGSV